VRINNRNVVFASKISSQKLILMPCRNAR